MCVCVRVCVCVCFLFSSLMMDFSYPVLSWVDLCAPYVNDMMVPEPTPDWDSNRLSMSPEILSNTGNGVRRKTLEPHWMSFCLAFEDEALKVFPKSEFLTPLMVKAPCLNS